MSQSKASATPPAPPQTLREMKVLVVDDEHDRRRTLEVALNDTGATFVVTEAQNDGTDRSFSARVSRTDFLALMAGLRHHEGILR